MRSMGAQRGPGRPAQTRGAVHDTRSSPVLERTEHGARLPCIRNTTHVYGASVAGNTILSYTSASATVQPMLGTCS